MLFTCWTCRSTSCPWVTQPVEFTVEMLNVTYLLSALRARSKRSSHNVLSAPSSRSAYVSHELPFPPVTTTGIIPKQFLGAEDFVTPQLTEGCVSTWSDSAVHLCNKIWCNCSQSGTVQACGFLHCLEKCLPCNIVVISLKIIVLLSGN